MDDDVREAVEQLPSPTNEKIEEGAETVAVDAGVVEAAQVQSAQTVEAGAPADPGAALPPPIDEDLLPDYLSDDAEGQGTAGAGRHGGSRSRGGIGVKNQGGQPSDITGAGQVTGTGAFRKEDGGKRASASGEEVGKPQKLPKKAVIALIALAVVVIGVLVTVTVLQSRGRSGGTDSGSEDKNGGPSGSASIRAFEFSDIDIQIDPILDEQAGNPHVIYASSVTKDQIQKMERIATMCFSSQSLPNNVQVNNFNYLGYMVGSGTLFLEHELIDFQESVVYLVYQVQAIEYLENGELVPLDYIWYIGFSGVYLNGRLNDNTYTTVSSVVDCQGGTLYGTYSIQTLVNEIRDRYREAFVDTTEIRFENILPPIVLSTTRKLGNNKDAGFIFPNSDTEVIPIDQIEQLSDQDLRMAINELWARHGYIFKNQELLDYYSTFDWYVPTIQADDWNALGEDAFLNDVELSNEGRLVSERERRLVSPPGQE